MRMECGVFFLFNTQLHSMIELVLLNICPTEGVQIFD
jgi:hypothetical protein